MSGISNLDKLLNSLSPKLMPQECVFCSLKGTLIDYAHLKPIASFQEAEGLTLVLPKTQAQQQGIKFTAVFSQITLNVHSSLEAVGLTAAVSSALSSANISANVIAAYYHDHIFVPIEKSQLAMDVLKQLCLDNQFEKRD